MTKIAVYPGTFDPITFGHLDLIQRAHLIFDQIIVGVAADTTKSVLFTLKERVELIVGVLRDLNLHNVTVMSFQGLLIDFANNNKAKVIIRGLRAVADFEYEFQMSYMNYKLSPNLETVFLPATERGNFISSTFVKQIGKLKGDLTEFVPDTVRKALINKYL